MKTSVEFVCISRFTGSSTTYTVPWVERVICVDNGKSEAHGSYPYIAYQDVQQLILLKIQLVLCVFPMNLFHRGMSLQINHVSFGRKQIV